MIENFEDYLQLIFLAAQLPSVPRDLIFINLHKGFNQELCQEIREYKYHLMVGLYSCLSIIEEKPRGVGEAI